MRTIRFHWVMAVMLAGVSACNQQSTRLQDDSGVGGTGNFSCTAIPIPAAASSRLASDGTLLESPAFTFQVSMLRNEAPVVSNLVSALTVANGVPVSTLPMANSLRHNFIYSARALGDHTLTFYVLEPGMGGTASCTALVTVAEADAAVSSITLTPASLNIPLGNTRAFSASATYSNGSSITVTNQAEWTSSNPTVATLSNVGATKGQLSTFAEGTTVITASFGGKSTTALVTVTAAVLVSIAVTPTVASIAKGRILDFVATGTYSNNTTSNITQMVNWSSSDLVVASIGNTTATKGMLSALSVGSTNIVATRGAISSPAVTATVTAAELQSLSINPQSPSIRITEKAFLAAVGTMTDLTTQDYTSRVNWTASDATRASVSNTAPNKGEVTALALGQSTISISFGALNASTAVTVVPAQLLSVSISPASPSLLLGNSANLTLTGHYSDGQTANLTQSATWSTSSYFSVSVGATGASGGVIVAEGPPEARITAAFGGRQATVNVVVNARQLYFYKTWAGNGDFTLNQILGSGHAFDGFNFRNRRFKIFVVEHLLSRLALPEKEGYLESDIQTDFNTGNFYRILSINRNRAERTAADSANNPDCQHVPDFHFSSTMMYYEVVKQSSFLNLANPTAATYLFKDEQRDRWAIEGQGCYPSVHSSLIYGLVNAPVSAPTFTGGVWSADGFTNTYGNGAYAYVDTAGELHLRYQTQTQASRVVFLVGIVADP
jgi:hypothetical protein